jgi:cytochrome c biogenesis protein CcdA
MQAKPITDRLATLVEEQLTAGAETYAPPRPDTQAAEESLKNRLQDLTIPAIILAGLLDGINPCAFTTIVFLISMLTHLGKGRREILAVGASFTVAVFGTYLLLGVGLLGAVKAFSVNAGISKALTWSVGLLAIALAAWSLLDAIRFRRSGDSKAISLHLPESLRKRINTVIRKGLSTRGLIVGSFGIGIAVSLLESVCTGQVYGPTIMLLARTPHLRGYGIPYLLLYNVMFILPLLIVFAIAHRGVSSQRLGEFLRQHLFATKIAMALLFAGLGALLLAGAL